MICDYCGQEEKGKSCDCVGAITGEIQPGSFGESFVARISTKNESIHARSGGKTEKATVDALRKLADDWPQTLWLFSANGRLCVMKKNEHGVRAMLPSGGVDRGYEVARIDIENDGGGW